MPNRSQQQNADLADPRSSELATVRVMTLNLWGRHGAWDDRRSVLIDGLRALKPDLIAFQESVKNDGYDQAADLLGPEYHILHQGARAADGAGESIASRWPVGEVREVDLHLTAGADASAGWVSRAVALEVLLPDPVGLLLFVHYTTAWQWGAEHAREQQAVAAAHFIDQVAGQRSVHVVLAGDFNAPPDAASMRFWRGQQSLGGMSVCYADAWESTYPDEAGHTFTPHNPLVANGDMPLERGRRIDYVLARCGNHGPTLDAVSCAIAFGEAVNGIWASDHFGVVADFAAVQTLHN
jgi:endonuclease/exonuclease/phosphatase family metal-dependent hydrolase